MRIMRVLATAFALGMSAGFWHPPSGTAQEARGTKSVTPAAKVGDEVIPLEEVEQALSDQLAKIEQQRFQLLEQKIEQLIGNRLLAQEAKKRGMSVEQLLKAEVYPRAPEVTEDEVTTFLTQNRARLPQGAEAELRLKVWDYLRSQKVNQQRQVYVQSLRTQTKVTVYLEEPAATRVTVSADRGFRRGPEEAPVAMVGTASWSSPSSCSSRGGGTGRS